MKTILQAIFLLAFSLSARSQTQVSYSVQAHDDDWQLFMSSKIMSDMTAGGKVVLITMTAGDGGNGAGSGPSTIPYYLARERGSIYSSKYASDLAGGNISDTPTAARVTISGHSIIRYSYNNNKVINYFLRLPDGNYNGTGFESTGFKSLQKLYLGTIPTISSVDGVTTFTSWNDLTATIKAIMLAEKGFDQQVWVHTASLDTTSSNPVLRNSEGHSDHYFSSKAVHVATSNLLWVGINQFIDYRSLSLPANLSATDHANATALFSVCTWGLMESKYLGAFEVNHKSWLPMDYFSVERAPTGAAGFLINPEGGMGAAGNNNSTLTEIPMIVSITSPAFVDKDISMIISPYETGTLNTSLYNEAGKKIYEMDTKLERKDGFVVTLKKAVQTPGNYIIKNTLNNKYIETRKVVVQ